MAEHQSSFLETFQPSTDPTDSQGFKPDLISRGLVSALLRGRVDAPDRPRSWRRQRGACRGEVIAKHVADPRGCRLRPRGPEVVAASATIYEPEIEAFGGPDGMTAAHRLFTADSRFVHDHLATNDTPYRRELPFIRGGPMSRIACS